MSEYQSRDMRHNSDPLQGVTATRGDVSARYWELAGNSRAHWYTQQG